MNELVPTTRAALKRRKALRAPVADPLDLFYAGIGYLGVFYESQLVYLKTQLETPGDHDSIMRTMESIQALLLRTIAQYPANAPLNQTVREFVEANQESVQGLALDGRLMAHRIEEEMRKR
jgi:hypothetical protein